MKLNHCVIIQYRMNADVVSHNLVLYNVLTYSTKLVPEMGTPNVITKYYEVLLM